MNIKSGSLEVGSAAGMVTYVDVESRIGLMEKESGESQTKTKSCGHVCRRRAETNALPPVEAACLSSSSVASHT